MRIEIDATACSGHGRCYDIAPELFDVDDEGRGVVRSSDVPSHLRDTAARAAVNCPERAVRTD
jgi:ferredoxin